MSWNAYRKVVQETPLNLFLAGTLGVDTGPGGDGVHIGTLPQQAIGKFIAEDYDTTPVYTDETTGANNATANDMHLFPASPAENDAALFCHATKFFGIDLTIGTKAVDAVLTVVWEYSKAGSTWGTLTPTLDETEALLVNGTGAKKVRFIPPSDWAPTTVTGISGSYYIVRARVSAFTSITTVPLGSRVYIRDFAHGIGVQALAARTIRALQWTVGTNSGSTADSQFLLVNITKGTFQDFTVDKGIVAGQETGLALGLSAGDLMAVVQVKEDGTTEFANMSLMLRPYV